MYRPIVPNPSLFVHSISQERFMEGRSSWAWREQNLLYSKIMKVSTSAVKGRPRGFTIVELLIVIVVIAILAAISVVAYSGIQERARMSYLLSDIAAIKKAMELYKADHGHYPPCPGDPTPSECLFDTGILPQLVPDYSSSLSTYNFNYVRTAAGSSTSWGMRYRSNTAPYNVNVTGNCKFGVNMTAAWYSSAPECGSS